MLGMSYRPTAFAIDEYYHIYNRGNSKQIIFKTTSDYERFICLLYLSNSERSFKIRDIGAQDLFTVDMGKPIVSIGAYCLMPNHFHILIKPLAENGITTFMKKLSTGYAMYFNRKYERAGVLFEGKFKARYVDTDQYLKYLFAYIHLNPLKLIEPDWRKQGLMNISGAKEYLDRYKFSSYQDFMKVNRKESVILDASRFPEYFPSPDSFLDELKEWMSFEEQI